jgi:hypothetical protein
MILVFGLLALAHLYQQQLAELDTARANLALTNCTISGHFLVETGCWSAGLYRSCHKAFAWYNATLNGTTIKGRGMYLYREHGLGLRAPDPVRAVFPFTVCIPAYLSHHWSDEEAMVDFKENEPVGKRFPCWVSLKSPDWVGP